MKKTKFIMQFESGLNPLADLIWPAGYMFDTPVLEKLFF